MYLILLLLGALCLGYFLCIAFFTGHGTNFYFIWLFLGAGAMSLSLLLKKGIWEQRIPGWFRKIFVALVCVGILAFVLVEGLSGGAGGTDEKERAFQGASVPAG